MQKPRHVFKDSSLQQQFERDGYVVVPFLKKEKLEQISQVFQELDSGIYEGFYTSLFSRDSAYKKKANYWIREICGEEPHQYLQSYKHLIANFLIKEPGANSELAVHQDWTFVEEEMFTSVNCWIPVTPLTEENGPLMLMKGSHRLLKGARRGSPFFPTPIDDVRGEILERYLVTPKVEPGEALIHDNALVHYSPANRSSKTRIAVCLNMVPEEAGLIHYFRSSDGKVEKFNIDQEFYTSFNIGERPNYPDSEVIEDFQVNKLSAADLALFYEREYGIKPKGKSSPSVWKRFFSKYLISSQS